MAKSQIKRVGYPATDTITLYLDQIGGLGSYLPGQHLMVSCQLNGQRLTRTYSLCTSPEIDSEAAITIRRIPEGKLSGYLVDQAKQGMELEIDGPFGGFTTKPDPEKERHLILLAAGSGITPLFSILRSILYREPRSHISLIYTNRSFDRIIFYQQLQELEQQFSKRFRIYHALSNSENLPEDLTPFYKGSLSRLVLKKQIKTLLEEGQQFPEFYLCGPAGFMQIAEEAIVSLGIAPENIFKEHFFLPEAKPETDFSSLPERVVRIDWQERKYPVVVPGGKSILQASLEEGILLPHSCQEGQCGLCRSRLIKGEIKMRHNFILDSEELAAGQVLLCQGFPLTDDVEVQPIYQAG